MTEKLEEKLTLLGSPTEWPRSPDEARLEWVPNPHPETLYLVRFTCPEFTSICPVTGQPDFAHLVIDYVPKERLLESKSLKLFLGSFRNHGAFHEDCTLVVAKPPCRRSASPVACLRHRASPHLERRHGPLGTPRTLCCPRFIP
jgi:7-cyano-7-deazaguanine reductase